MLLNPKEAAHILGVSVRTIIGMIHAGMLKGERVNRKQWAVAKEALDEYLCEHLHASSEAGS